MCGTVRNERQDLKNRGLQERVLEASKLRTAFGRFIHNGLIRVQSVSAHYKINIQANSLSDVL